MLKLTRQLTMAVSLLLSPCGMSTETINVDHDNAECLGFKFQYLGDDDHIIVTLPPRKQTERVTSTLVHYYLLEQHQFTNHNKMISTDASYTVEVGFTHGIDNGADAALHAYYQTGCDDDGACSGSQFFRIASLASFITDKQTACEKPKPGIDKDTEKRLAKMQDGLG